MKFNRLLVIATLQFVTLQNFSVAWAQNVPSPNERQPEPVMVVPTQLTNFERYAANPDLPLVHLSFPAVLADLAPHISLTLTPRALTPFDAPGTLKALAVEFHLSQTPPVNRIADVSKAHSVTTLLDFDEVLAFRSVFNALAAMGVPQPPFPDARAVVHLTSKTGMHLEFTAEQGCRIQCLVSNEDDSIGFSLDFDSARKLADAFTAAFRTLDAAKDSRT
jgi:hypothetical protein